MLPFDHLAQEIARRGTGHHRHRRIRRPHRARDCDPESRGSSAAADSYGWRARCTRSRASIACSICESTKNAGSSPAAFRYGFTSMPADRLPRILGQQNRILGHRRRLAQRFQNGDRIPNRNPLPQQVLEDLLHSRQREQFRNQIFDHFRIVFRDAIQNILGVLAREQFVRVAADQLRQMRAQNADAHRPRCIPCDARMVGVVRRNPQRLESRTPVLAPAIPSSGWRRSPPGMNRQLAVLHQLEARDLRALQQHHIFARLELQDCR